MLSNLSANRRTIWFWAAIGTMAVLVALVVLSPPFKGFADQAIAWAQATMEQHPGTGVLVFFLFSAVSAMLAFASSVVLVPPASAVWGKPLTVLLLWGGWVLGAVAAYGIGRLAYPLLARSGYADKLAKYQNYVSQRMKFWAVLLFCIAVPSEIPGYLFGTMHYPFPKFLAAIAIAETGYGIGIVVAGESLAIDRPLPFLIAVGILAIVAVLAGLALRTARKRKSGGLRRR
ncbi:MULTISPECIES: TVP38/TMEM64 family protein [unclassified Cupriavidus]|uniref:TVP38/TMEM64 family protein n=1 Tax=unclassified Cupriavidus TaxID=2640874 RepID=UPI0003FA2BAC|nr:MULTISPECIES: VTT domain-containing protein [unclassified Cupriavidus]MBP0627659.1 VTT domain-containing protein [Cupriavidus sp. AcVe19-1a]MBP0635601.1 VTT domain-containing protein [Cupriavidus sp. AcVe19-6a]